MYLDIQALEQAERGRARGWQPSMTGQAGAISTDAPVDAAADIQGEERDRITRPAAGRTARYASNRVDKAVAGVDGHLVSLVAPSTFAAEQYRSLRHVIEQRRARDRMSVIAVSSPAVGDGTTTTAINLAAALAQAPDTTVLLIEANLRNPSVARELALGDAGPGLVGAITGDAVTLGDVVLCQPPSTLDILPAGSPVPNPYELLVSARFGALIEAARRHYDYVVLDTPPLVSIPDCRAVADSVHGFLVVVAAHRTPRSLVVEAISAVDPSKLIGLVFNQDDGPGAGYRAYASAAPRTGGRASRWERAVARARDLFQAVRSGRHR